MSKRMGFEPMKEFPLYMFSSVHLQSLSQYNILKYKTKYRNWNLNNYSLCQKPDLNLIILSLISEKKRVIPG